MAKMTLKARAFVAFALVGAIAAACGNSDDNSNSNGNGDGDGDGDNPVGNTGGTVISTGGGSSTGGMPNSTGGSMNPASACDGLAVVGGTDPHIDELENPDGTGPRETAEIPARDNRVGSWFIANDMTLGAVQTPEDSLPTEGVGVDGSDGFATSATGFADPTAPNGPWGANFGLSLNTQGQAGCSYDASAFDGIGFCAKSGDGETHSLNVAVPIPAIIPATPDRGGTCLGEGCDDSHFKTIAIGADWECHEIEWGELAQNAGWIHENKYDFDPSNIAQITWNSPAGNYDVIIDNVRFLGDGTGAGGEGGSN